MIDYDPHQWRKHLLDIRGSMLKEIVARVLTCAVWSVVVTLLWHYSHFRGVPLTLHTIIGTALGLLLVFRTNASYDRFWEGRKQWGGIVNETRNLGRAAGVWLKNAPDLHRAVTLWTIEWCFATMHTLRGTAGLGPSALELPEHEVQAIMKADHVPLAIAHRISDLLNEGRRRGLYDTYAQLAMDHDLQQLVDYLGACERIHKTPLPFAYVVHLRRALILYCFTLPFALVDSFGWLTIPATLLAAYTFFGIEEIGVEIEDPFGFDDNDLPLERICGTIEGNLKGLLARTADPPHPPATL